jgi:hypothetical protein
LALYRLKRGLKLFVSHVGLETVLAVRSPEMSVSFYHSTRRHILEDSSLLLVTRIAILVTGTHFSGSVNVFAIFTLLRVGHVSSVAVSLVTFLPTVLCIKNNSNVLLRQKMALRKLTWFTECSTPDSVVSTGMFNVYPVTPMAVFI